MICPNFQPPCIHTLSIAHLGRIRVYFHVLDFGRGHVTYFGQWYVSRSDHGSVQNLGLNMPLVPFLHLCCPKNMLSVAHSLVQGGGGDICCTGPPLAEANLWQGTPAKKIDR